MHCHVNYFKNQKGQMKIQEMAFVLVAILIFFGIIAIFFLKIGLSGLQGNVENQRTQEANEIVRKLAVTPEFSFTSKDCDNCVDLDKVMALKDRKAYSGFWGLDYLQIKILYPGKTGECTKGNYPDCQTITLIKNNNNTGIAKSAFVALCRQDFKQGGYVKCELGRISASGKSLDSLGVAK